MNIQQTVWKVSIIIILLIYTILNAKVLKVEKLIDGLHKPIFLTAPINSSDTLFIVEQQGVIKILQNGELLSNPLLEIKDRVYQSRMLGDERGLLGMALHPNFRKNGYFFINYVNRSDYTIISRYEVNKMSYIETALTEKVILKFKQPYSNHNGGSLVFGPDGMLYIGIGDGGYAGDPDGNGQNLNTIFGSILRLNIDESFPYSIPADNPFVGQRDVREEIWCFGLRNPWRFSFDLMNGDLYIGDVGQNNWEEINYSPMQIAGGSNFGWNHMEGYHCYPPDDTCENNSFILPVFEYPNNANYIKTLIGWNQNSAQGCSVTGGYVYRGKSIAGLQGLYIFGDYCTGKIWSFIMHNGIFQEYTEWNIDGVRDDMYLSSFGEDGLGELYLLNHTGSIYEIVGIE